MSILITLLTGLVIGGLAKLLFPGKQPGGIIATMLLGIAGSFVAALVGQALGLCVMGTATGLLASVLGSMALLGIFHLVTRSQRAC